MEIDIGGIYCFSGLYTVMISVLAQIGLRIVYVDDLEEVFQYAF